MKNIKLFAHAGMMLLSLSPLSLQASTFFFHGAFATDDQFQQFSFQLPTGGPVTVKTFGYGGGTNHLGQAVEPGGFDTVLTLFDAVGNFLTSNDDGACGVVNKDALTQNCFDSFLSLSLGAGDYLLVLTENDNLAVGPTLADGFTQSGNGNFSCPEFMGTVGAFCDASPSQRSGGWSLDITLPGGNAVPEPASAWMILTAGIAIAGIRKFSTWRKS